MPIRVIWTQWNSGVRGYWCRHCNQHIESGCLFDVWMVAGPLSLYGDWLGFHCVDCIRAMDVAYNYYLEASEIGCRFIYYDLELAQAYMPGMVPKLEKI